VWASDIYDKSVEINIMFGTKLLELATRICNTGHRAANWKALCTFDPGLSKLPTGGGRGEFGPKAENLFRGHF